MARGPMSLNGRFEFKFPFEPPTEDLRAEGTASNGVKFYIYDTCVERDPEKRAEIDRRVAGILVHAERRKLLEKEACKQDGRDEPERRTSV